jgi:hypothetical protein
MVETRKVADIFSEKLIPLNNQYIDVDVLSEEKKPSLLSQALGLFGIKSNMLTAAPKEKEAPSVFSYSLYFVYYD